VSNSPNRRRLHRLPKTLHKNVPLADIQIRPDSDYTVPLSEREGVFLHTFKCGEPCFLEFEVRSWKRERHTLATVCCPECGGSPSIHWLFIASESPKFSLGMKNEIYAMVKGDIVEIVPPGTASRRPR
jgi:hypothetical protein